MLVVRLLYPEGECRQDERRASVATRNNYRQSPTATNKKNNSMDTVKYELIASADRKYNMTAIYQGTGTGV